MTAPDARGLAEIVEEGRRLEAVQAEARRVSALDPFGPDFSASLALGEASLAVGRFYRQHGPTLLAVAEAAVGVLADHDERVAIYGKREEQPNRRRVMEALRAAVRGEEKGS